MMPACWGAQGGIGGKPSRKACVCSCILVHAGAVQRRKREGREGVSQGRKGCRWLRWTEGVGVSVAHLLSSHLLYNTTRSSPECPISSAGAGESQETQSHRAALCSATLVSPLQVSGLDDHLAPGYHLGLLSQGTVKGRSGPRLPHEEQP